MRRLLLAFAFLASQCTGALPAFAEAVVLVRLPDGRYLLAGEAEKLSLTGDKGVWWPEADARAIRELAAAAPAKAEDLRLCERDGLLGTRENLTLRVALNDSMAQTAVVQQQLERTVAGREEDRRRAASWLRAPATWLAVGVLGTVAAILAVR